MSELQPERLVQLFAEWSRLQGDEDQRNTDPIEWCQDYLNNYHIGFKDDSEDPELLLITVNMGAFDHGAGSCTLAYDSNCGVVFYEDTATVFVHKTSIGMILQNIERII